MSTPRTLDDAAVVARVDEYQHLPPKERAVARQRLIDAFPELAGDIEACLNGLDLLSDFGPAIQNDVADFVGEFAEKEQLGDFLLLRQIGRGGMGVVYEALQRSLGRKVALKILPYAAFLDPSRLQRFKQEAQSAAALSHSNIVQVFCVGVERGVHYYAMELIGGQTLADVISGLSENLSTAQRDLQMRETIPLNALTTQYSRNRSAFYERAARLGGDLAEALHYAHSQGVVHRDVKPSNVLIDERGKPWLTDFGLAQTQDDRGLTLTGDVLGTLRYMSPEQADERKLLDHRTDVYALGATLAELIALKPLVSGDGRAELLRRLQDGQTTRPRAIDPKIPKDLENILLKATAHAAEDRYESAAEFAEDLARFSERKPVRARPIGRTTKLIRWVRRHRLVSSLVAVASLLLLFLAVTGPLVAFRFQRLAAVAEVHARAAQVVAEDARRARREVARNNSELIDVMADTLNTVQQVIENVPDNAFVSRDLVTTTITNFERLMEKDPQNRKLRFHAARAYHDLSWAVDFRYDDAPLDWIQKSRALLEELIREDPSNFQYRDYLGGVFWQLAHDRHIRPRENGLRCLEIYQGLVEADPSNPKWRYLLGVSLGSMAIVHWSSDQLEARKLFSRCDTTFEVLTSEFPDDEYRCGRGHFLMHFGSRLSAIGNYVEATEVLGKGLEVFGEDFSNSSLQTRYRISHGELLHELGFAELQLGQLGVAERHIRRGIDELREIHTGFPDASWARNAYYKGRWAFVELLRAQRRDDEALAVGRTLLSEFDDTDTPLKAKLQKSLGTILWWQGEREKARGLLRQAIHGSDPLVAMSLLSSFPDESIRNPNAVLELAARNPQAARPEYLGASYYYLGDWSHAKHELLKALEHQANASAQLLLAMACCELGDVNQAHQWLEAGRERLETKGNGHELIHWKALESLTSLAEMMLRDATETHETRQ